MTKALEYSDGLLRVLDQTKLPESIEYVECSTYLEVADAIKSMKVRGAPAIGAAAAYGVSLGADSIDCDSEKDFFRELNIVAETIKSTRPTAVNLFWAVERTVAAGLEAGGRGVPEIKKAIKLMADRIALEDEEANRKLGQNGAVLLKDGASVLTHCNAGALATVGYGTALGVIRAARDAGKSIHVYADETRPFLQGARLTAWELLQDGIPVTVITDNMAGYVMSQGLIDAVIVGADRIAANGDTANKIGTYSVAILAKEHGIPFYVAAPVSTLDMTIPDGAHIPIEQRDPSEVTHIGGKRLVPEGAAVINPAFDVTPNRYISAIVTEKGVARPPYEQSLKGLISRE